MNGPAEVALIDQINAALRDQDTRIASTGPVTRGDHATITCALPPDLAPGETLLLFTRTNGAGVAAAPVGWDLLGGDSQFFAFTRCARTGDGAPTVTFTGGQPGDRSIAWIFRAVTALDL
jgi:hypothetical protein